MKRRHLLMLLALLLFVPAVVDAQLSSPIVSAPWLRDNLNDPRIFVLDIRKPDEFKAGHVPGSFNLTYTAWQSLEEGLECQLTGKEDLQDSICSTGMRSDSKVIIVGKTDTDRDRVNMTRVAWTLKYAGIERPSILDGGYRSWQRNNYPTESGWHKREKSSYRCRLNERVLATKDQVKKGPAGAVIVDTRLPQFFSGKQLQPPLKRKGHIPGAVNLPYSFVFHKNGTFEDVARLKTYASAKVGDNLDREVIVLCCNGASSRRHGGSR